MGRGWKIALSLWAGFWTVVFFAATVPAKQAVSNLGSWFEYFDLTQWPHVALPHIVLSKGSDSFMQIVSAAAALAPAGRVVWGMLSDEAKEKLRSYSDDIRLRLHYFLHPGPK